MLTNGIMQIEMIHTDKHGWTIGDSSLAIGVEKVRLYTHVSQ